MARQIQPRISDEYIEQVQKQVAFWKPLCTSYRLNPEQFLGPHGEPKPFAGGYEAHSLFHTGSGYAMGGFDVLILLQRNGIWRIGKIDAPETRKLSELRGEEVNFRTSSLIQKSCPTQNIYDYSCLEGIMYMYGSMEKFQEAKRFIHDDLFEAEHVTTSYSFKHGNMYFSIEDLATADLESLIKGQYFTVIDGKLKKSNIDSETSEDIMACFELRGKTVPYDGCPLKLDDHDVNETPSEYILRQDIREKLCYDIVNGLSHLHHEDVIHGDIKSDNILIYSGTNGPLAVISDFDMAILTSHTNLRQHFGKGGARGHATMSPETAKQNPTDADALTPKSKLDDIFSLGKVMFAISTGKSLDSLVNSLIPSPNIPRQERMRWYLKHKLPEILKIAEHELRRSEMHQMYLDITLKCLHREFKTAEEVSNEIIMNISDYHVIDGRHRTGYLWEKQNVLTELTTGFRQWYDEEFEK